MTEYRIHFRHPDTPPWKVQRNKEQTACGIWTEKLTDDVAKVTCLNCQKKVAKSCVPSSVAK